MSARRRAVLARLKWQGQRELYCCIIARHAAQPLTCKVLHLLDQGSRSARFVLGPASYLTLQDGHQARKSDGAPNAQALACHLQLIEVS